MIDDKKTYQELSEENQRLKKELKTLKCSFNEDFSGFFNDNKHSESIKLSEKIRELGAVFNNIESKNNLLKEYFEVLDIFGYGIAVFTKGGKLTSSNKSFSRLIGMKPQKFIDAYWKSFFDLDNINAAKHILGELKSDYPVHKDLIIPSVNGQKSLNCSVYHLKNRTYFLNVKDITIEKEKLLTIQEQAFLLRSSHEFMAVCNNVFEFSFLNDAGIKILALSGSFLDINFIDFIKNKAFFKSEIIPKVIQKRGWIGELVIDNKNREFPVNCEIIPFENKLNPSGGFYIVLRDITERKEAIKKLVDAKDLAEDNMESRQQFLANISHEIRTPMNAIIGLSNLLVDTGLIGKQAEFANSIKLSAANLLVIINDILDFSKSESGKLTIEQVNFNLDELLSGVKSIFEHKIESKGLYFNFERDSNIPTYLIGDPKRLNQILMNLISNAEKFTSEGSILVSTKLIKKSKDIIRLQLSVKDTGIGIAKENFTKIFQPFTQESENTTRLYGGTGLGLAIVKQLVDLQNGEIWVESKINRGTSFFVEIEYRIKKLTKEKSNTINLSFTESKLKQARIIMAEDYPMNRLLAKSLFDKWGLNLTLVNNGEELLKQLDAKSYDIILMDIQMPGLDGLEATRILRKRGLKTPVIALTAHAFKEEQIQCAKAGMDDFLSKPFNEKDLKDKLITYLNLKLNDLSNSEVKERVERVNSSLEYFNLKYIRELSAGDEEFVLEILEMFLEQVPALLNKMIVNLNDGRRSDMAKIAHKVQTSFAMVERKDLKDGLKKLEIWGKGEGSLKNPIDEFYSILQKSSLVIGSIADYLGKTIEVKFIPLEVLSEVDEFKDLIVDFSKLEDLGGGDKVFEKEMITLFISQTLDQIEKIKKMTKSELFKEIGLIAHNMIASFDLIGCEILVESSRRVEELCYNFKEGQSIAFKINDFVDLAVLSVSAVEKKAKLEGILK